MVCSYAVYFDDLATYTAAFSDFSNERLTLLYF